MSSILEVLGGLGMFLFGMRTMSAGLQKVAGQKLRGLLASLTKNRFTGIFSGFVLTCGVQSSSATTVMIVSFANAGLLDLTQAMGPVMGANIGTTITGWLVSILGFKVKISSFALPIIGIGFPLTMLRSQQNKNWGETLIGFGLLFLGLAALKDSVPHVDAGNASSLAFLKDWGSHGYASALLFVLVGTVMTIVIQSSSATMAITLALAYEGWIDLETAAAMVLGENLGTTITAYLAALGGTRTAKRVARSHFVFNVLGVLWILPMLYPFVGLLKSLVPTETPMQLAAFHTAFNVINTSILMWFIPQIRRIVEWMIPYNELEKGHDQIRYFDAGLQQTPEIAVIEVRRALHNMLDVVLDMFRKVQNVIQNPDTNRGDLVDEIKRGEDRTDRMEEEIVEFCTRLSREATSQEVAREVAAGFDMANDIERMGDHCFNLIMLAQRAYDEKYKYDEASREQLQKVMRLVEEFIEVAASALNPDSPTVITEAKLLEGKINAARDEARLVHSQMMQSGALEVRAGLVYLDMMTNFEKLGDYCYNVAEMVTEHMERWN